MSIAITTIIVHPNLFGTMTELNLFVTLFSRLVPLRSPVEVELCLVCDDRILQVGFFLLIKVTQIARGMHQMHLQLARSQFIRDSFFYLVFTLGHNSDRALRFQAFLS